MVPEQTGVGPGARQKNTADADAFGGSPELEQEMPDLEFDFVAAWSGLGYHITHLSFGALPKISWGEAGWDRG